MYVGGRNTAVASCVEFWSQKNRSRTEDGAAKCSTLDSGTMEKCH